jgi:HEAT repeat protein
MWPSLPPLPRTFEACLRDIKDEKIAVRISALADVVRYAEESEEEVVRAVMSGAKDASVDVRAAALSALGEIGSNEALPVLLAAVEDDDAIVRQMAVQSLGQIADRRALARLTRALEDDRPEVRFQAVIALPKIAPEETPSVLKIALGDPDPAIRYIGLRVAEEQLEIVCDDPARGETYDMAARGALVDEAANVRVAAALLLARRGGHDGRDVVLDVVEGRIRPEDPQDEAACVDVAGDLAMSSAIPALERRAFGATRLFRECFPLLARISLAKLGHARARATIVAELGAWSLERRTLAVIAAGRVPMREARPALLKMRSRPDLADPDAVEVALAALE